MIMINGFWPWKRLRQIIKFMSLFSLCFLLTVACNQQPNTTPSPTVTTTGDRITIGTTAQPRTIDPADSYEMSGLTVIYNLSDTLYTYELGSTTLTPQLATEMPTVSDDGLTYTIPLREGVTFHDNTPFNAEAMAFSLERFINNGGKPSFLLADTIDSVEATGEYELTITLKQPFSAFPALLAFPGACAVSPQAYQIGEGKFIPDNLVGTGPYKLNNFTSDSVQLDVFENYWGQKPNNKGIDLQIYPTNPANLFNAFRTQAVDVAYQALTAEQIEQLQQDADSGKGQVIANPGTAIAFMALNVQTEFVQQKPVRQAIASVMDRQLLNNRILKGQGEPLYSMIPTAFEASQPVFQERYGDNDKEAAKKLLQEAGFSSENPATIEIWHSSGSVNSSQVAAILKSLAERDLDGMLQFIPNSIASAAFFKNLSQGLYQSILSNWYPDFLDADNYIYPFLYCAKGSAEEGCIEGGSQSQGSFYYNEQVNELISQQRQESDPQQRQQIFAQIQEILAEDAPYIPLWQTKEYAFAQNNINGVTINPSQTFPFWTISRQSTN
ncbi:ABC transporter, substrate binding protein, possibly oligopeptides [Crocosphaera subtropica ATCC 51142]|uniref:ABC transporter, substrate binding protein, possibly oligopeptides n=2 Tax=Crocosphaera TaxID=263510 RepID=B1WT45_CROS5|nr:ABC transporter, substrate binding protein, possibly oligopeptides [Crocosphaera subtropica ATCC 51142]